MVKLREGKVTMTQTKKKLKTNGMIVSFGQHRTYLLYVPASYDPATPMPLVISMHGFAEWPAHQMQISGWNKLADEYGFIVVYPSGSGFPRRWLASGRVGDSSDPMLDVIFISDLIDELKRQYNIEPARVYANGLSNGGGMSFLLGCKLSDRITAVGSVSGAYLFPLDGCKPSRPVPMIAFHGTADPIVPYQGGPSRRFNIPFPAIPEWMAARRNSTAVPGRHPNCPGAVRSAGLNTQDALKEPMLSFTPYRAADMPGRVGSPCQNGSWAIPRRILTQRG